MEKAQGANIGLVLGCTLINVCGGDLAQAAIQVGGSALFAKFGRDDEREADQEAIANVVRAGIHPKGIPEMFQILLNERQRAPSGVEGWFSTHPGEEERVRETQAVINTTAFSAFKSRVASLPAPPPPARR
jgi:predicted Zn-dependent protease